MSAPHRVLFVDDDENILNAFRRGLRKAVDLHTATGGRAGLEAVKQHGPFAVIVSDQQMPDMDGTAFLKAAKQHSPHSVRIMLTGNADQATAIEAVNQGAIFRFLNKPCSTHDLAKALGAGLRQYDLVMAERDLLEKTLAGSIKLLIDILALSDPEGFSKVARVREWGRLIAGKIEGLNAWELDMAILLSRIGHAVLPGDLLEKQRQHQALTEHERHLLEQAPATAHDLIINIPRLEGVAQAVREQMRPALQTSSLTARVLRILNDLAEATAQRLPCATAWNALKAAPEAYDQNLLGILKETLRPRVGETQTQDENLDLRVSGLREGDELLRDILLLSGEKALAAGFRLTDVTIRKIRHFHNLHGIREPISVRRQI